MAGLSPKLPIALDASDGFKVTKTYQEMIIQNFKNLLLTVPGEKMMDVDFGVGLRKFLFEPNDPSTYSEIQARIRQQVAKYMPFVAIENIEFRGPSDTGFTDPANFMGGNSLSIKLTFKIIPLGITDILKLP